MLRQRRDKVVASLKALPGVTCPVPDGAFYVFPDVTGLLTNSGFATDTELCDALLDQVGLAVVPGRAFGMPGHLRLSFAYADHDLDAGLSRLAAFATQRFSEPAHSGC